MRRAADRIAFRAFIVQRDQLGAVDRLGRAPGHAAQPFRRAAHAACGIGFNQAIAAVFVILVEQQLNRFVGVAQLARAQPPRGEQVIEIEDADMRAQRPQRQQHPQGHRIGPRPRQQPGGHRAQPQPLRRDCRQRQRELGIGLYPIGHKQRDRDQHQVRTRGKGHRAAGQHGQRDRAQQDIPAPCGNNALPAAAHLRDRMERRHHQRGGQDMRDPIPRQGDAPQPQHQRTAQHFVGLAGQAGEMVQLAAGEPFGVMFIDVLGNQFAQKQMTR